MCLICNKRILKLVQPNFFCYFSLKKGRIFSITHNLPEECPFASYEDLRKHWKLMVGVPLRFLELSFCVEKWWQVTSGSFIFICRCYFPFYTVWIQTTGSGKCFLQRTFLLYPWENVYVSFRWTCLYRQCADFS